MGNNGRKRDIIFKKGFWEIWTTLVGRGNQGGRGVSCYLSNGILGKGGVIQMWAESIDSLYPRIHHNLGI